MRQAGRYLPEYRKTREQAGGFLDLCYAPHLAEEVTLQPIRRYGFDAAILFADILLIPEALGQNYGSKPGGAAADTDCKWRCIADGRRGGAFGTDQRDGGALITLFARPNHVNRFCGAPWTVASYMVAGRGTPDQAPAKALALQDAGAFQSIIDKLVAATIEYLAAQVEAGAEVLQLFESWAASGRGCI